MATAAFGSAANTALPLSVSFDSASQVAETSPQNPLEQTPQQEFFSLGNVNDSDQKMLVETASTYRNNWTTDRLERFRIWTRNVLMYKGVQCIEWDANSNMWYDALSWYRQNQPEDGEVTKLERWFNNITLMLGTAWVGNMSRGVPQTVVRPENANVLADVTTAHAASEAISIIERRNLGRQMVRGEFEMLYLYGCYFKYTRGVLDGNWSGYDEEPIFGMTMVQIPARKQCFNCNRETPMDQLGAGDMHACPNCGAGMGPESYYPAGQKKSLSIVGMQKVPRAMVRQTIHSPMEIDADPSAKQLNKTPILAFDQEIDIGEARMMLPKMREKIQEGAPASTSGISDFEKLRRSEVNSMTSGYPADTEQQRPTYSQIWMQPISYYRLGDYDFAGRMLMAFPDGLRMTMIGDQVVDIRAAVLEKQWSQARLHEGFGIYCPSIAERVVGFNERLNAVMQVIDDWTQRAALGLNVMDGARVDSEKMKGRRMVASTIVEIPMRINGEPRPMSETFAHFDLPIADRLWEYPNMLITMCELVAGMPPQTFGVGTQPGVETLGGQQQMLNQASVAMTPYWENVKEEHAIAAQNAIECLQELMKCGAVKEILEVVDAMGSAYRNNYVNWDMMKGRVKVYPDEDQGLPQRPEDLRDMYMMMFKELTSGNPAAKALFDVPVNQESILTVIAPGLEPPLEAQRSKTLQDINTILEQPWIPVMNKDGSIGYQPSVMPEKNVEDFPTAKETVRKFRQSNFKLRIDNPQGWSALEAYYDQLEEFDMQVAAEAAQRNQQVQQAGAPPKQGPPPEQQAALQELMGLSKQMADRLAQIAMMDPMQTKGTAAAQVSAANDILQSTLKANEAMAK